MSKNVDRQLNFDASTGEEIPVYIGWYQPHAAVDIDFTGQESLTKQSFKDECDINNIVASFSRTGQITHLNERAAQGMFTDLPDSFEYQDALNAVIAGEQAFAALPSALRERFHNDPAEFLDFMSNPDNQEEAIKLGVATRRPEPAPEQPQAPTPPPAPPPEPKGS